MESKLEINYFVLICEKYDLDRNQFNWWKIFIHIRILHEFNKFMITYYTANLE